MNKTKIIISLAVLVMGLMVGSVNIYAFSRYEQKGVYIRNTYVISEVGLENDYDAYSYVQASDYVDAYMDGMVFFNDGDSDYVRGGFDQRTYGSIGRTFDKRINLYFCYFTVSTDSTDRSWSLSVSIP